MIGKFYTGVSVGVAEAQLDPESESQQVVGLSFPLPEPVRPDDLEHGDNFEDVFLSIPAAKAMLIDLRDAIDAVTSGVPFE